MLLSAENLKVSFFMYLTVELSHSLINIVPTL